MTRRPDDHGSAAAPDAGAPGDPQHRRCCSQSLTITRRNLIHIRRMPEMLMDVTIQPVMFVLLFAFVFGGAIATESPAGYNEWLLAGIMGQTIAFSSFIVAVGLTADIDKGIVDRMRSLPIHPAAVLVGRSISSLIHSSIGILVMSLTGLVDRLADPRLADRRRCAAYGLLLLWGFAMIWLGILVGSAMRSVEAVQGVMFTTIFPLTFLSNAFAPTEPMGPILRTDRRVEPDLVAGAGDPRAVGQHPAGTRRTPPCRSSTRSSRR